MTPCPSCSNTGATRLHYPEGVIHICPSCRLQWGSPNKQEKGFIPTCNTHYLCEESFAGIETYRPYVDFFETVEQHFGGGNLKILDIGCGTGVFVKACLLRGHDAFGVEADTNLARHTPPETRGRIRFELAEKLAGLDETYDVLTFVDSFEHFQDPFALLEKLAPVLCPGGLVYIRTNNARDIYNATALFLLRAFPALGRKVVKSCFNFPDHCWNFTREAMANMAGSWGWRVAKAQLDETPAFRLTASAPFRLAINAAYLVNKAMGAGKVCNYYLSREPGQGA